MNALVPYAEMKSMARDIASSGLFGLKNETQVLALMAVAQAEQKHPAIVARDFDIVNGRPAKKAEAMLRDFIAAGGKIEWHRLDDECADATFSHAQGGSVRISWDMARARNAGLAGKDMYKKFPRQMLRSRVVSEGVRTVAPLATSGFYVPEELQDMPAANGQQAPREVDMGRAEEVLPEAPSELLDAAESAARDGLAAYQDFWRGLQPAARKQIGPQRHETYKALAMQAPGAEIVGASE